VEVFVLNNLKQARRLTRSTTTARMMSLDSSDHRVAHLVAQTGKTFLVVCVITLLALTVPTAFAGLHMRKLVGCLPRGEPLVFHGPRSRRAVAMTFDDGPGPSTPKFVALLEQEHVRATFFQVGDRIARFVNVDALDRRMLGDGDMIGDQTWSNANVAPGWLRRASSCSKTSVVFTCARSARSREGDRVADFSPHEAEISAAVAVVDFFRNAELPPQVPASPSRTSTRMRSATTGSRSTVTVADRPSSLTVGVWGERHY
jgi:polysaccharide deacetylase